MIHVLIRRTPLLAAIAGISMSAGAQQAGDTVRVTLRDSVVTRGVLLAHDSLGVDLRPAGTLDTVRAIRGARTRFEVLRGYHQPGMRAVGRGAAAGAGAGLVLFAAGMAAGGSHGSETAGLGVIIFPALGATLGMLHGAATGFVDAPDWQEFIPGAPPVNALVSRTRGSPVSRGDTIRLRTDAGDMVGRLVQTRTNALAITALGSSDTSIVPLAEIHESVVRRPRGRVGMRALGYGALGGLLVGTTYGALTHETGMPLLLGGLGLLAGTIVSLPATMIPTTPWIAFDAQALRVTPPVR